jgi:hypothetical protein
MRKFVFALVIALSFLSGCAHRVLVKDCHDAGPGIQNCEKVQDL